MDLTTPAGMMLGLRPELVLSAMIMIVLLVVAWRHHTPEDSRRAGWLSLISLLLTGGALLWLSLSAPEDPAMGLMIAVDLYRFAASSLILLLSAGAILCSLGY